MDEVQVGDTVHRWKTWYRGKKLKSPLDAKLMTGQVGILRKILPNKYVIQTSKDGKPYIACFNKKDWVRYLTTKEHHDQRIAQEGDEFVCQHTGHKLELPPPQHRSYTNGSR